MKVLCFCGREERHELPFDDFHVERVPCKPSCKTVAKALGQRPVQNDMPQIVSGNGPRAMGFMAFFNTGT